MRICVQHTKSNPTDYVDVDSSDWSTIAAKPEPTGGETIDDADGWIFRTCIQGVEFTADHYALEVLPGLACRFSVWNDDPDDYPIGYRYARVWTFQTLAPDYSLPGAHRGKYNTRQSQEIFADADPMGARLDALKQAWKPFDDFVPPDARLVRHGIWVPKDLHDAHEAVRSSLDWHQWTEGIPERHLTNDRARTGQKILRIGAGEP